MGCGCEKNGKKKRQQSSNSSTSTLPKRSINSTDFSNVFRGIAQAGGSGRPTSFYCVPDVGPILQQLFVPSESLRVTFPKERMDLQGILGSSISSNPSTDLYMSVDKVIETNAETPRTIPKIIHHVWFDLGHGATPPTDKYNVFQQRLETMFPSSEGWKTYIWNYEESTHMIETCAPDFLPVWQSLENPIFQIDCIRYFLMFWVGGYYLDLDILVDKNFDAFLTNMQQCIPSNVILAKSGHSPFHLSNFFIGSVPRNPFWFYVVQSLAESSKSFWNRPRSGIGVLNVSGPTFLDGCFRKYQKEFLKHQDTQKKTHLDLNAYKYSKGIYRFADIVILPNYTFYPPRIPQTLGKPNGNFEHLFYNRHRNDQESKEQTMLHFQRVALNDGTAVTIALKSFSTDYNLEQEYETTSTQNSIHNLQEWMFGLDPLFGYHQFHSSWNLFENALSDVMFWFIIVLSVVAFALIVAFVVIQSKK